MMGPDTKHTVHEAELVGILLAIHLIKTGCTTHAIGVLYVINSVPTGASKDRGPFNPDECHTAPVAMNPSYASLMVTHTETQLGTSTPLLHLRLRIISRRGIRGS